MKDLLNEINQGLNPEDIRRVEDLQYACNILLVGIGTLTIKRVRGQMFMECKYDGEYLSNDNSQAWV
jgi:hypothetical protein